MPALQKEIVTRPLASFFLLLLKKYTYIFLSLLAVTLVSGCEPSNSEIIYSGSVMGTTYEVKIISSKRIIPGMEKLIDTKLQSINKIFTTYDKSSELMILNESPINVPQIVSSDMMNVLAIAQDVYIKTNGSFDPTVASLVNLWGFGPQLSAQKIPNDQQIASLLNLIGLNKLLIDKEKNLVTRLADIKIDLSAIAKGYAVDYTARLLDGYKIENYLVEIGGELRMKGNNANGTNWIIAIERPYFIQTGVQEVIQITDSGLATSGDYRNYFEKDGSRYSHMIDPRSGYPIKHNLVSATVIAKSATEADAFSTAMMVLGPQQAIKVAKENNISVYLIIKNGENFDAIFSKEFNQYLTGE